MALNLLLSPVISVLVKKAGNSLIEEFCNMYKMSDNLRKLRRQLLMIQKVIASSEDRAMNEPYVRAWLKELNVVAYKAVDLLSEFQYEARREKALSQQPCSSIKKVSFVYNNIEMSRKLNNVLGEISEIIAEMNKFNFVPLNYSQPAISRPPTHSCVIESDIVGRDSDKESIVNTILDPSRAMENVSVLCIVGMGGAGKTTLAQLVYNDEKVKGSFELQMWVSASDHDFNTMNIVKSMIEVAKNECVSTSNMEVLQNNLHKIIYGKKYLLVLDDVWNEKINKWDALRTLLWSAGSSGSVILFTTRSKNVASNVETLPRHDLATLSDEHSWELFRNRAFGKDQELPHLFKIGKIIVRKCAGLPLALKAIGGLMRTKRELHEWRAISDDKIWESEPSNKEVLPALKLSYDQIPTYMKQCFAFCAIYPHGYEIEKETLIQLWKANDFIPNDGTMDIEDKCEFIFDELCRRSFFQDIKQKTYLRLYNFITLEEKHTYCKMHDLMCYLAKYIAGNQCATTLHEAESDEVLHLSMSDFGNQSLENLNNILKEFPNIRTCLISKFANESQNDKLPNLTTSLRALQISKVNGLPKELGYMKHLRYLDLSYSEFDYLPESTCTLYNLHTLILSNSKISKLPDDMRYMIGLQDLVFDGCWYLKSLPISLGQLKCLRTLNKYMIGPDPGRSIGELKDLDLRGSLFLTGIENVGDKNEAEMANMVSKTKLYYLLLSWEPLCHGESIKDDEESIRNDEAVLEGLKPCKNIEHLVLVDYSGFEFAVWMKDLSAIWNLRTLKLYGCINCEALPPVWKLPLLEHLKLCKMISLLYICSTGSIEDKKGGDLTTFPSLKWLELSNLDNLKGWHENDCKLAAFPMLQDLRIDKCPKLESIPFTPMLRKFDICNSSGIKLLQISNIAMAASFELQITFIPSLTEPDAFRPPKNVEQMTVRGLESVVPLEENDEENGQKMALRRLEIWKSDCFFSCGPSKLSLGFWKYFVSLESLLIGLCNALSYWPEQELRSLKFLKILLIYECQNLTYFTQVSPLTHISGKSFLPRLEDLQIWNCPKLAEVPNCSTSLKNLGIQDCPSLSKEGLKWIKNLPELKSISIRNCTGLKSLPDGYPTSLEHLRIIECPGIDSFSEGLRQQLPKLKSLQIWECPALERRCGDGGDYHNLVTAIPTKYIGW